MDSLKENQISYETPDFTLLNDLIKKESQKNIDYESNPRIKELLEEIKSTNDEYEIIQLCGRIHEHDPDNVMAFIHQGEQFTYFGELEKAQDSFEKAVQKANGTSAFVYEMFAIFVFIPRKSSIPRRSNCLIRVTLIINFNFILPNIAIIESISAKLGAEHPPAAFT